MSESSLNCREHRRRAAVRSAALFGLDYAEVSDNQRSISVFFLGKAPPGLARANIRLLGGQRIRDIAVVNLVVHRQADPTLDDFMEIQVDKAGDFSTYTLAVVRLDTKGKPTGLPAEGFDPRYYSVDFSFKAACPSALDCKPQHLCPPPLRPQPAINYLAKDYASFRQLILDRLALVMPQWQETHVPDIGITLVELLAYVGDYLSYYQDAVATEAYLGTARQRISVRRHARLVDYAMHEGCNARAWITLNTDTDLTLDPAQIYFVTPFAGAPARNILTPADLVNVPVASYDAFEPLLPADGELDIHAAHSEIQFHTWGDCQCCLARGATTATLVDRWVPVQAPPVPASPPAAAAGAPAATAGRAAPPGDGPPGTVRALQLKPGDVLILEEVIGPRSGNPADADPRHRQAVRLTRVTPAIDPLYHPEGPDFGQAIVDIEWAQDDALAFTLCISTQAPPPKCDCLENVSVARGNVILVDHGSRRSEPIGTVPTDASTEHCASECAPAGITLTPGLFRPVLGQHPLTFAQPLPPCGSARALSVQEPHLCLPDIALEDSPAAAPWSARADLLASGPDARHFVVEVDDDGVAHLRFGDGSLGRKPDAGSAFRADYRTGNGSAGNVGAETLRFLVLRQSTLSGVTLLPRNPLPASGGIDPEPVAEVKLFAPTAFRDVLQRAIIADDYARLAADNPRRQAARMCATSTQEANGTDTAYTDTCAAPMVALQGAKATLRWTGSWYTALVALDPLGSEQASPALLHELAAYLEPYRRVGHDLVVAPADYVPLDLALTICVRPDALRGQVEAELRRVLGNGILADGRQGLFHPDQLQFGTGIFVSRIVAAAQAVAGVQDVQVTRLERWELAEPAPAESDADALPTGSALKLGPLEIARLDNDPNFPENGRLALTLRGGR